MKVELHQLAEKYADLRVRDGARERRLATSIAEHGQQTPIAVMQDGDRFVLLDGYARVKALRQLGRDATGEFLGRIRSSSRENAPSHASAWSSSCIESGDEVRISGGRQHGAAGQHQENPRPRLMYSLLG